MKKLKILILLVVHFLFSSCENGTEKSDIFYHIVSPEKTDLVYSFDDIIEDYSLISIESDSQSMIGEIDKVIINEGKIYIMDKSIAKTVLVFDEEGNFENKIGRVGRGPGEYTQLGDFIINQRENEVWIYCENSNTIHIYSNNGTFIRSINTGLKFSAFEFLNSDTLIAFTHSVYNYNSENEPIKYNLIAFDLNMNICNKQFYNHADEGESYLSLSDYFCPTNDKFYLNWIFNDTIYVLNGLEASPFIALDFKEKRLSPQLLENKSNREILLEVMEGRAGAVLKQVQATDNLMMIPFSIGPSDRDGEFFKEYYILRDLSTNNQITFSNIETDSTFMWAPPITIQNDYFISVLPPDNDNLDINRKTVNPSLLVYKFKELDLINEVSL